MPLETITDNQLNKDIELDEQFEDASEVLHLLNHEDEEDDSLCKVEEINKDQETDTDGKVQQDAGSPSPSVLIDPTSPTPARGKSEYPIDGAESSPAKTPSKRKLTEVSDRFHVTLDGPDGYFDQHSGKPVLSSNPVSKMPQLGLTEYVEHIRQADQFQDVERQRLNDYYESIFAQWTFELSQGFNILLHGVGSKRKLLLSFVDRQLSDYNVLVVNGYNPSTTLHEVITLMAPYLVDKKTANRLPKSLSEAVATLMSTSSGSEVPGGDIYDPKLVIVIHNIDGRPFRNDKVQSYLAHLASHSDVSIIASVDHINAPLLFDSAKLSSFRFIWHDTTTFISYTDETSFEDPLGFGGSQSKNTSANVNLKNQGSGVRYVLESLTANARALYRVLISHQLQSLEDESQFDASETVFSNGTSAKNNQLQRNGAVVGSIVEGLVKYGMDSKILYQQCAEEFIVTNELNFRTMLTEFYEHEMLASSKDQIGTEIIYSPFDKLTLERLLEDDILNQ
ncbi:origin recognition complex subunit 2-domain-containing protein [Lipomyces oligophaga]|uniref:origin recognition complex subunit 2-domain-containing protein n=1 Tax=Lipomyces oligophaga TaxID=45792 RepID=UPI0034CFCA00